jgi:riboflavin synthase
MSMFTGIVSAVGVVIEADPNRIGIDHAATVRRLKRGSSVAINGCCLTVVKKSGTAFFADVVPETLRRTNLGRLKVGVHVNLELPTAANGLLDGHLVQGHIDAPATVKRVNHAAAGKEVEIEMPGDIGRFVAERGSIAVDGVSLTVAGVDDEQGTFSVVLIPHTLAATIAHDYKPGSIVNLEIDVVARYVARNLHR